MRLRLTVPVLVFLLSSCGTAPGPRREAKQASIPRPADEARRFPKEGLVRMELVEGPMLGVKGMPGGNVADYTRKGKPFQQFLVRAKDTQAAALLLFDTKAVLEQPKYLAHMGGYFGQKDGKPVYLFAKGPWIAGTIGLPEPEADIRMREFAGQMN